MPQRNGILILLKEFENFHVTILFFMRTKIMRPTPVKQFQLEPKSGIIAIWMINRIKMFLYVSIFGNEKSF